jgi:hypothetical protein
MAGTAQTETKDKGLRTINERNNEQRMSELGDGNCEKM